MKPLSNEVMKAKAPSIFASEPFYDVSDNTKSKISKNFDIITTWGY